MLVENPISPERCPQSPDTHAASWELSDVPATCFRKVFPHSTNWKSQPSPPRPHQSLMIQSLMMSYNLTRSLLAGFYEVFETVIIGHG